MAHITRPVTLYAGLVVSVAAPGPSAYGAWYAGKAAADIWDSAMHGGSGLGFVFLTPLAVIAGAFAIGLGALAVAWLVAIAFALRPLDSDESWTAGPLMVMHGAAGAFFALVTIGQLGSPLGPRPMIVAAVLVSTTAFALLAAARKTVRPQRTG